MSRNYFDTLDDMFWDCMRMTEHVFKVLYGSTVHRWRAADNSWRVASSLVPTTIVPLQIEPDGSYMHTSSPRKGEFIQIIKYATGDIRYAVILWVSSGRVGYKMLLGGEYDSVDVSDLESIHTGMERVRWKL